MLPFGDDYFSFLETYQERSNDEDESDNERSQMSSSSSFSVFSEGNDEQECTFTCTTSFDLPKSPVGPDTSESQEDSDNEDEGVEGGWDELIASFRERVVSVVSVVSACCFRCFHQTTRRHIRPREICRPSIKEGKRSEKGARCPQSIILLLSSFELRAYLRRWCLKNLREEREPAKKLERSPLSL